MTDILDLAWHQKDFGKKVESDVLPDMGHGLWSKVKMKMNN